MKRYLAFDIESGGVDPKEVSGLEYYFVVLDENFKELKSLHLKTKPDNDLYVVTGESMGIHKIDLAAHTKEAVYEREAKTTLYNFLKEYSDSGSIKLIPIGHNVNFDIAFINEKLLTRKTWNNFVTYRSRDTSVIAGFLKDVGYLPETVNGSLGDLITYFKVDGANSHRAEDDIRATIDVYKKMMSLLDLSTDNYN